MALFKTTKNVFFQDLDITVLESDVVELDDATAKDLINKLADVFPGETVLIEVTEAGEQKPKRSRKKKAETETTETEEVEA
ncbi:hypothetical protein SM121_04800 [Streptococcus sp. S1]|uniref:Uncharacterized protein n=1 Tax=Streptococcus dentalis TaxID=3098075 RepID=A0ABZ0T650_9STRE|nr:hypothetical protein [Streptococcus sp. S1]WPS54806.1 hypothetical protein SM121_04800 [Streptococcus sp. S1]